MIPQDGIHPVAGFQLCEHGHKFQQFVSAAVHEVAGEYSQIGILPVTEVDGFLKCLSVPFPASGMNVRQLQDAVSVECVRKVRRIEGDFFHLKVFLSLDCSEQYIPKGEQCRC